MSLVECMLLHMSVCICECVSVSVCEFVRLGVAV